MPRLVVPVERDEHYRSRISPHFGRAPLFAVVEISQDGVARSLEMVESMGEHAGGRGFAHDAVADLRPDAVVVMGMGPRGLQRFQNDGVAVFTGDVTTVGEAVEAYVRGQLRGLTEACREARHRF